MFFCVCMPMAQVEQQRINDYWSTDFLISTPAFGKLMSRDRVLLLLHHLRFSDKYQYQNSEYRLVNKFSTNFKPFQDSCVNESLVLWRGRLAFCQYIPQKRHMFELKLYICDIETGYILDFIVYTGDETEIDLDRNLGVSVVNTLMRPYLGMGHNLYIDSWYASPILFQHLHENNTGACGTVRPNRKGMPELPAVNHGDTVACHKNNVMCLKWGKKSVWFIFM